MKTLAMFLALFALMLVPVACDMDFPGATALDEYVLGVAESGQVAQVTCQPATILDGEVSETSICMAQNAAGTRLSTSGTNVVIWSSSAPAVASVDISGVVQAESPGTVWIRAEGTMGSVDSTQVTVN